MIFRYAVAFLLLLLSFQSYAGRIINSVTLSPNPASIGDTVSVSISVTGTGSGNTTRWRSTSYSVDGGSDVCVNTDNFRSTSLETDTFDISGLTSTSGTYEIDFTAYRGNECNDDDSDVYSTTLTVAPDISEITLSPDTIFDTEASLNAIIGDLDTVSSSGYSSSISLTYSPNTDVGSCPAGTADNWRFSISNNVLSIGNASGSTMPIGEYIICVQTDDLAFSQNLTIYVEENPAGVTTEISLSNDTIYNYVAYAGTEIGDLTVIDPKSSSTVSLHTHDGNTFAGSCAAGATDNWRFGITNNILSISNDSTTALDPGEYTICVKTEDDYFRQNLIIYVEEPDEYPTFFTLSNTVMQLSNSVPDAEVGELISSDEDITYIFGTSAVHYSNEDVNVGECVGDFSDNQYFYVSGSTLHLQSWINTTFEAREYTICIKGETGNGIEYLQMFSISVSDDLTATYLDKFNTQSYGNNDGLLDWASDWQEYSDDDDVDSGDIEIENNRLHLVGNYSFIYREVDLSSFSEASLSLDYELITNGSDDDAYILIRTDDNDTWTILYTFEGGSDEQGSLSPIDISEYISSDTDVGIYTVDGFDNNDDIYIDNFAINASGTATEAEHIYFDRFDSVSYSNNDGELDWDGDWNESNDDDDPDDGKITIVNDELKITSPNVSITREADLSGYSALTLSFSYRSLTSGSDDIINLQIRSSNGNWTTLKSFVGSSSSNDSGDFSIDISAYIASDVDFRFITEDGFDANDAFYVDDFAIDNTLAGSCPDISAYELIFHDDFSESVYQLNDTWSADNFDRTSTNVWPNDNIYTTSGEELDIVFEIDNETLQIAGDVTNLGNSEYGVLLHDVSSQGYSSSAIDEYAIETSISAYADEIGNNDVGIVFGYQSEDDFYLLRWTKIGSGYATDTYFPGTYRSLDLLWIKDGSPTLLTSQPSFYSDDPMSIRITVDADGISICINGDDVMSYSGVQPSMHSVGLFSYDNDYDSGFQVNDFKIYCSACEAEDIIGWWPMEDSLEDLIGVNDLSEIGDIQFGSSNVAKTIGNNSTCKYAIMDGESYGQVDDSGHLNSEELAVSAWVYPTSYPNDANDTNGSDTLMAISSKDENYEFHINNNGKLYWWWRNESSTARFLTSSNTVPLNAWSHVAISYKAGEQKMYINGVLESSSSWNEIPKQSSCDYFVGADVATGSCSVISARTFIGELDEVRIYGRYLEQTEIAADMERLRECGLVNDVYEYRITHPQNNLSCMSTSVTVEACSDENCSAVIGEVTANLQFSLGSDTTTLSALDLTDSAQQVDFDYTSLDTITLGLNNMAPSAAVQCFYNTGIQSSCDITYNQFGYIVTASDITSSDTISDPNNLVYVQAVEAIENNPAVCEPALVGEKLVNIDFAYIDHPDNYDEESLKVSLDDSTYVNVISGSGTNQTLDFNNTDAKASFYVRYGDAGSLQLSVSDSNGEVVTGYDNFVVIPHNISLVMDDGSSLLGVAGNETHYAGQNFNLTIQALNADGNVTNNYRPESLQLQPVMSSPLINDGADSVQFYYGGSSPIGTTNTAEWSSSMPLVFDNNGYASSVASFDNVGSFYVDVRDSNYLGYEINSNSSTTAGRFTPAYFSIEDVTDSPGLSIENTRVDFSYIGEELNYETTPTFNYIAKTYTNLTATNYGGSSYQFNTNPFDLSFRSYVENNSAPGFVGYTDESISISGTTDYDGVMQFTLPDTFTFVKSAEAVAPISPVSIEFDIPIADLTDDDGIGYDSDGINSDLPIYENYVFSDIGGAEVRYGRLRLENAYGDEAATLKVEMVLEYWNGERFITNIDDSTTDFSTFIPYMTKVDDYDYDIDDFISILKPESSGKNFVNGVTEGSEGLFVYNSNDDEKSPAIIFLEITNLLNNLGYLNIDWNDDGVIDTNDKVSSTIIFGRYRGNDRIIYKRER